MLNNILNNNHQSNKDEEPQSQDKFQIDGNSKNLENKEVSDLKYNQNRNQMIIQAAIMIICGILSFVYQNEMEQDHLRYKYKENIAFKSIIIIFCLFFSCIVILLSLKYKGKFEKASYLVLIFIRFYLLSSQLIIFEISIMCKLYVNPILILIMANQTNKFIDIIFYSKQNYINSIIIHLMILYAILRILIEFQIIQNNIISSIINFILIIISFLSDLTKSKQMTKLQLINSELLKENSDIIQFYTNIIDRIPHGISIINEEMKVIFANQKICSIFKCKKKEDLLQKLHNLDIYNFKINKNKKQNKFNENNQDLYFILNKKKIKQIQQMTNNNNNQTKQLNVINSQSNSSNQKSRYNLLQIALKVIFNYQDHLNNEGNFPGKFNSVHSQSDNKTPLNNLMNIEAESENQPLKNKNGEHFSVEDNQKEENYEFEARPEFKKNYHFKLIQNNLEIQNEFEQIKNEKNIPSKIQSSSSDNNKLKNRKSSNLSSSPQQKEQQQQNIIKERNNKFNNYILQQEQNIQKTSNKSQFLILNVDDQSKRMKSLETEYYIYRNFHKYFFSNQISNGRIFNNTCLYLLLEIRENLKLTNEEQLIKDLNQVIRYIMIQQYGYDNFIDFYLILYNQKFHLQNQSFCLKKLLRECLVIIQVQTQLKNISLCLQFEQQKYYDFSSNDQIELLFNEFNEPEQEVFSICSDQSRIKQIVLTLLLNSIKFTNKGSITIKAEVINKQPIAVKITCVDTGVGFTEDQLKYLRQSLSYFISSKQFDHQVNLQTIYYICKVLSPVEYQNNPLVIESLGKQQGSSFSFVILDQPNEDQNN